MTIDQITELEITCFMYKYIKNFYFFYFYLYIYPPDSQESDGGAVHRVGNYPNLLPEMPRYCFPLVIYQRYDCNLELLAKATKQGKVPK